MVDLEPSSSAAANTLGIDPVASEPIAFEHRPARRAGNVSGAKRGRRGRGRRGRGRRERGRRS
jgi:hypothetical protein